MFIWHSITALLEVTVQINDHYFSDIVIRSLYLHGKQHSKDESEC